MITLTSFKIWHADPDPNQAAYSIAVYQPKWLPRLDETRVFDIRDANGNWIRPRDFVPDGHDATKPDFELLNSYRDALYLLYAGRSVAIQRFLGRATKDLALCCWCPYDKAAQRQIHDYGGFVCHSAVVEVFLRDLGHEVLRDADRERMVTFT